MSIAINVDDVVAVLLQDGWHDVRERSFDLDAYEYVLGEERGFVSFEPESGVTYQGFTFINATGERIAGPMTAILAVKERTSDW